MVCVIVESVQNQKVTHLMDSNTGVCVCVCSASVMLRYESLSEDVVLVDPQRKPASLSFWINKENYSSQQALLWCLSRTSSKRQCVPEATAGVLKCVCVCLCSGCDEEPQCSVADLGAAESPSYFSCQLYPDSRVCGAYDKPLRQACRHLLDRTPNNTYSKKGKYSQKHVQVRRHSTGHRNRVYSGLEEEQCCGFFI